MPLIFKIMDKFTKDYIKAYRKKSRDTEIKLYSKPLNHNKIWELTHKYKRIKKVIIEDD